MLASEVFTCRIRRGSLARGMKLLPSAARETVPTMPRRGEITGSRRMSWRSISSSASAQVAFSGTEMTLGNHQVAHARRDIAEVERQRLVETREDGVDAGVGVAAARRDVAAFAARLLVGGVGDGRADGVGVGVLVSDDVNGMGDPFDGLRAGGRGSGSRHASRQDWRSRRAGGSGKWPGAMAAGRTKRWTDAGPGARGRCRPRPTPAGVPPAVPTPPLAVA